MSHTWQIRKHMYNYSENLKGNKSFWILKSIWTDSVWRWCDIKTYCRILFSSDIQPLCVLTNWQTCNIPL